MYNTEMKQSKYFYFTIIIILFIGACNQNKIDNNAGLNSKNDSVVNNSSSFSSNDTTNKVTSTQDNWQKKYLFAKNKNSVKLNIKKVGSEIMGELKFLYLMKDNRLGILSKGIIKGDTLFALYDSMQEGQRNLCEVAFLKDGNNFIISNDIFGFDNYQYNENYSKGWFKNKSKIKFNGVTLLEIPKN